MPLQACNTVWKLYHNLCSSAKRESWPKSLNSRKAGYSSFFQSNEERKVWCACCTDQECWEASASHQTTSVLVVYHFTLLMAGMCCSSMAQLAAGVSNPVPTFSWLPFPWAAQRMAGWAAKRLLPRRLTASGLPRLALREQMGRAGFFSGWEREGIIFGCPWGGQHS